MVKNHGHNPHYDLGAVLRPFLKWTESIQQAATISPFERRPRKVKNKFSRENIRKGAEPVQPNAENSCQKDRPPPCSSLAQWFSKCGPQASSTWELLRKFSAPPRPTLRVAPASRVSLMHAQMCTPRV